MPQSARRSVPREVAEAVLGYAKQRIVAIYNKHQYRDERRDALDRYAAHVLKLVESRKGAVGG